MWPMIAALLQCDGAASAASAAPDEAVGVIAAIASTTWIDSQLLL
jgi:hypothetical protein